MLDRKVKFVQKELFLPILKMSAISLVTAIFLYIPMKLLDQLVFDTTRTIELIVLTSIATAVGLSVYLLLSWLFKVEQIVVFYNFAKRIIRLPAKLARPAPTSIDAQQPNP